VKVTLDSSILVGAFGPGRQRGQNLLRALFAGDHRLVLSNEILSETSRVLRYARLRSRHGLSDGEVYEYVEVLRSVAAIITLDPLVMAPIRDANDIAVMQTALIGTAEVLCTTDKDFFNPPAFDFLHEAGITVLTDLKLMARLRS
jgi:putative PIN family toxin of toxin-antitoxin system